ncbi:MAG: paraquat-inducible protein A [Gammaproteobacteria bacterium]|nr:paraquat-inducible protein A [Gammaproteobacteria bacterium]
MPSIESNSLTARQAGLLRCHSCAQLHQVDDQKHCQRCEATLHQRKPNSVQRSWAWLLAGMILYIPANLMPMMQSELLGQVQQSTIMSGVLELVAHGSLLVATVVFVASILVPVLKFMALLYLLLSIQRRSPRRLREKMRLYRLVELVGRWSMVDVFVVALLAALVQMGALAQIAPGPAASAFAATVVMSMLSALSLDPRLIWDRVEKYEP